MLALNNSQSIILSYTAHLSEIFEIWTQQVLTVAARILPSVSHIDNTTFLALTLLCDQVILNFHASAFAIAKIVYQCLNRMQTLVSFEVEIGMLDEYIQTRLPSILPINLPARELCPACQAIVPLSEPQRAKCINGHSWGAFFLPFTIFSRLEVVATKTNIFLFFCLFALARPLLNVTNNPCNARIPLLSELQETSVESRLAGQIFNR